MSKQFCKHGHDTFICGRSKHGACVQCRRDQEKARRRTPSYVAAHNDYSREYKVRRAAEDPAYLEKKRADWRVERARRRAAPGYAESVRRNNLLRKFGITLEQYNAMLASQNGCCAICQRAADEFKRRLAVDHCHRTGKVRGLLCVDCNTAIGKLSDDPNQFYKAVAYLTKE